MIQKTECNKCGQTSLILNDGETCFRKYDDNKGTCDGVMVASPDKLTRAERQARDRILRQEKGICRQCSNKLDFNSKAFCTEHLKKHRDRARERYANTND
jgi:hypothetical protein